MTLSAGRSICGPQRSINQDRFGLFPKRGLFFVADGVGGEANGAEAASIVARVLPTLVGSSRDLGARRGTSEDIELMRAAVRELHRQVGMVDATKRGRTTLVTVLLHSDTGLVAHLGDSRAYLLHEGSLIQLTKDHTLAQLLADTGEIETADVGSSPFRSQLTKCVGMAGNPTPDCRVFQWHPCDQLVLCSDGLTSTLPDETIKAVVCAASDPTGAVDELLMLAESQNAADNVTAVVIRASRTSCRL